MDIPNYSVQDWITELKPYQSNSMSALVASYGEEEAIKRWLSANGPTSTIQFGGGGNSPEPFVDRFKEEFRKFICGDESYDKYREQIMAESPIAKSMYISCISAALGATLGYSAALLAPAIAVMLHTVGAISINAWCNAT
jgi:hypothetical protein